MVEGHCKDVFRDSCVICEVEVTIIFSSDIKD